MLLADIGEVFADRNVERIWTCDLPGDLCEMEEKPWGSWKGEFTARILSNMLKNSGIRSTDLRFDGSVKKGCKREAFQGAFSRYLTETP